LDDPNGVTIYDAVLPNKSCKLDELYPKWTRNLKTEITGGRGRMWTTDFPYFRTT
jgi:hypothetical protein